MEESRPSVGMIGSGSWATAMLKMLGDNTSSKELLWWIRKEEDLAYVRQYKHNPTYLSAVELKVNPENLYQSARTVIQKSDIVILNTPSAYLEVALQDVEAADFEDKIIVSAIKGIVPGDNLIVGEYLQRNYQIPLENIVVVGGPCHAEEVSLEKLSYLTLAAKNNDNALRVAAVLQNRYIKTVTTSDVFGVEYGAVLKNIYALAGGICHGLGYGDNFQAVLVSNAIREMEKFVFAIDAEESRDINASAYLGDLLVTAYSQFSRNRTFGNMIGKGYTVQSAQLEMNMVAEGYYASACIQNIIQQYGLDMPICDTVYQILYNKQSAASEVVKLTEKLS
ncbi:NAD(P)H-dependent glycerol-3-phosphate dehydrogenase [Sphingobacterium psychroaquaticum]|uniref:Glycerol-3-phosphate dehydrogenase n=1 Tax=Sphingobacterium psychroaquaticum TaxID=561061 RepID=A0A1X7IPI5_9SPHI|nr:NAD(P)H-dependent glycerol-3-phosphate dehydrogenase [Sphingobacterium psychroaquaticum]QBQ41329.1 glycerol-3-phosphate dehydrogenase [Sphingobacterium psychroaquaticum]SMG16607.1 glycerol-3-phosphate dehydrogenase (NAD(P)+) [Sphingobacterium psychroaquaticum]